MSFKRLFKWTAIAVLSLVLLIVLYLTFGSLGWVGGVVEEKVSEATGRELRISGPFELELLWSPAIRIEDLTLTNAEWGSSPMMVKVGHFSARIDLWSLVFGPVLIEEVRLRDVEVLLETNEDGEANWTMGTGDEPAQQAPAGEPSSEAEVPLIVELAEIRNVGITYKEPAVEDRTINVALLDLTTDETLHLVLDGAGSINEYDWYLDGTVGPLGAVKRGDDIDLKLEGGLGNLQLGVDGHVATLGSLAGSELDLRIASEDIVPLIQSLSLPLAVSGPLLIEGELAAEGTDSTLTANATIGDIEGRFTAAFSPSGIEFEATISELDKIGAALDVEGLPALPLDVAGNVRAVEDAYELREVTARIGKVEASVSGTVGKSGTDIDVVVAGPHLDNVSPALPDIPFRVAAGVERSPERFYLSPVEIEAGESRVTASLEVEQGDALSVVGSLRAEKLDLTPFQTESPEVAIVASTALPELAEDEEPWDEEPTTDWLFVDEPLPFEQLGRDRLQLELEIDELLYGGKPVALDLQGTATLADGRFSLASDLMTPAGGRVVSDVSLATGEGRADLKVDLMARDLRPNLLSGDLEDTTRIPPADITLDLKSSGGSPRELAAAAEGRVLFTLGPGLASTGALERFSQDIVGQLIGALNPFAKEDPFVEYDCAVLAVDIEDGMATLGTLYSQGKKITIVGEGKVDLDTEKLRLVFNTKPRSGIGVSADMFVTPFVKLGGTLAHPRVGVAKKGALMTGGAAVLTGGLSLLAQAAKDRVTGEMDRCEEKLAEAGGHPPLEGW